MVGGHLPKKIYAFLIMMKYDDLYFASRYNFFTDCVEWYFLPKTEIKVFLKKMDIRGFGWRPSIFIIILNTIEQRFRSRSVLKRFTYSTRSKALEASNNNK